MLSILQVCKNVFIHVCYVCSPLTIYFLTIMHGAGPFPIAFDLKYSTLTQFWHMAGVHDNSGRKYMVLSEGGVSHT